VLTLYPRRVAELLFTVQTTPPVTAGGPASKPELRHAVVKFPLATRSATRPSVHGTKRMELENAVPPKAPLHTLAEKV